jgi:hypothetical protein
MHESSAMRNYAKELAELIAPPKQSFVAFGVLVIGIGAPAQRSVLITTDACANGCGLRLPDWLPIGPIAYEEVQNVLSRSD